MTAWPLVSLGNVIAHRKEFIQIDDSTVYQLCRVQWYGQGVILRGSALGLELKTKSQQVCRAGEFVVAEIDAKEGGFGVVPPGLDRAIVSGHYFLFEVNQTRLDPRYLGHYVKTPLFRDQVKAQGSTNYSAIRPSDVCTYTIPLPPLEEQKRIVERIEGFQRRIQTLSRITTEVETAAKILWTVIANPLFDGLVGGVRKPLGELVSLVGGGTPSKGNPEYWHGSIPWVSPKDMKTRIIQDSADHISSSAISGSAVN